MPRTYDEYLSMTREEMLSTYNMINDGKKALRDSYRYDGTPAETVRDFVAAVGYDAAAVLLASLINYHGWDGRISRANRTWAETVPDSWDENAAGKLYIWTDLHMCHLDQIVTAFRRADRAELVPETVPETAPETVPETVPETAPETVPETAPETAPETVPETAQETAPETAQAEPRNVKRTGYRVSVLWDALRRAVSGQVPAAHFSTSNSKLGAIPSFNLLPGVTCSAAACGSCLREGCYAVKNVFRAGYDYDKNVVLRAWAENTALALYHLDALEQEIRAFLDENRPRFFRIHSAGDMATADYAAMWARIAADYPGTRFLAFTKQWDIVRRVSFSALDNFSLVLSGWTGCAIPEDLRTLYRCAWCDDGQETRIPADALECPGSCETCGMCWALREIGKDTYFHKH